MVTTTLSVYRDTALLHGLGRIDRAKIAVENQPDCFFQTLELQTVGQ